MTIDKKNSWKSKKISSLGIIILSLLLIQNAFLFLSFNRTDTTNDSLKIITPMLPISQGEDIYTLTGPISDHFWSPDGSKVAYLKDPSGQTWNCELWVADKSPSSSQLINHQLIYTGAVYRGILDWKDDWILFMIRFEGTTPSTYYGANELWKIRVDGTDLTQITFTYTNGIGGSVNRGSVSMGWFVPGTSLVYFSAHNGNGWYRGFVCNDDGTDNWQHRSYPDYSFSSGISPTGNKLLWGTATYWNNPTTLRVCNVDGSGRTTIRSFTDYLVYPLVLVDGNTVVWHSNDNIYAIEMDGSNERTVIEDGYENRWWNYNPVDGQELIMGSDRADGNMHLFTINVDGTGLDQLTDGSYIDEYPMYSPDGQFLMYRRLPSGFDKDNTPQPWPYELVIKKLTSSTNDNQPVLSNGFASPLIGDQNTKFTFQVTYTDLDDNPPSFLNVVINGSSYPMQQDDPSDTNFTDGCLFQKDIYLTPSINNYSYYFECNDSVYYNASVIFNDIKVNKVNNYKPYLANPQLSPEIGNFDTLFNFTVWYYDSDNNYPTVINITINETIYLMSPIDVSDINATNGIQYFFNTSLAFGYYQFQINCSDGEFTNSTSWIDGPEVDPFYADLDVTLLNPLNLSSLFTNWVNFEWSSIEAPFGILNYTIQISNVSDFSEIVFEQEDIVELPSITNTSVYLNFPTGVYYWRIRPSFESFIGNWSDYFIFDLTANYFAPSLNFGSVTPTIGDQYTFFNFTVSYFDQDNNSPLSLNIIINGSSYAMDKVNLLDTDFTDGCIFQYLTTLPIASQNYTYSFNCSDGKYLQSSLFFNNLEVNPANYFTPQLLNPQIYPDLGGLSTIFDFTVWYFDEDNNLPTFVNITIDDTEYSMIQFNQSDINAIDGILFYFSTALNFGFHSFQVNCSDSKFTNSTEVIIGPEVNPFYGIPPNILLNPINNAELPANWINFSWKSLSASFGPVNYTLQISSVVNFSTLLYEIINIPETPNTTETQLNIDLPTGVYCWRVRPTFEIFGGNWSNNFKLNIIRNDFAPILISDTIFPSSGNQNTIFKFTAIYQDLDNNAPVSIRVIINGIPYVMEKQNPNDNDYADGCTYQFLTLLTPSEEAYTYSLECYDGVFYNSTSTYEGPIVSNDVPIYGRDEGLRNRDSENVMALSISLIIGLGIIVPSTVLTQIKSKKIKSKSITKSKTGLETKKSINKKYK